MKENDQSIYKRLVEAYYNNSFEATFQNILNNEFESIDEGKDVLATLCGAKVDDIEDDHAFILAIVQAITSTKVREKIVQKIRVCSNDCEVIEGKSKCQSVCPFDAILKNPIGNDKWIDEKLCQNCGQCITVCESGNYLDTKEFLPLAALLKENKQVVAIIAPAIAGQFGKEVSLDQLREAFMKVGFCDMVEVAMAADILSLKEALEYKLHVEHEGDFMITSCCCPVWIKLLKQKYNVLIPNVSPSVSPMIAMGRILKKLNPETKVVFIGPCIAKKAEAKEEDLVGTIDYVLTFEEVKTVFEVLDIDPKALRGVCSIDYASTGGRLYARSGGVSQAVYDLVDHLCPEKRSLFTSLQVDGVPNCRALLADLEAGKVDASFIEGMGCPGGCVGGPKRLVDREEGRVAVDQVAYDSAIKVPIHSEVLYEMLHRLEIPNFKSLVNQGSMFERTF